MRNLIRGLSQSCLHKDYARPFDQKLVKTISLEYTGIITKF
jgi:hypothetical protein